MKYLVLLIFTSLHINLFSQAQYQHWEWAKSFGGSGNDQTTDMKIKNGFLYVTGTFTSPQINWEGTILSNLGGQDIFVAKLDTSGNTIWAKSFGSNGDDKSLQLEINSTGAMLVRGTSASNSLNIGNSLLTNPANFYMVLDSNGNVLNAVSLPAGPVYADIDLDNSTGIYITGTYQHSFMFNGAMIDSSNGLAGAVLLKYNGNTAAWYKNMQVRMNKRYDWIDYDEIDPNNPPQPPFPVNYTPPITGDASATMQIEFNEQDTVLGIAGNVLRNGWLDNTQIPYDYANYGSPQSFIYGFKISPDGNISGANFHNPWSTFSGNSTSGFTTGLSGYSYTTSRYHTLGGYIDYTITSEKNNRQVSSLSRGFQTNGGGDTATPPEAWYPFQTDESGNHLLCNDYGITYSGVEPEKSNVIVLDTNLNRLKKTAVKEINRLPLSVRAMSDTHAIFFGSTYSDGALLVNENLPGNEISLPNSGQSEIFIGKYICDGISLPQLTYPYKTAYKTCNTTDSVQLFLNVSDSFGAAPYTFHWQASSHFSDTTILNPTVHFGGDTIVNRLTITDANGMKFSKDFVFFGGKPSDLTLVVSNTNICSNDSVVLSLAGTTFSPCTVSGIPWYYNQSSDASNFTSIGQQIKYPASYSHTVFLTPDYYKEHFTPSAYCITKVPVNINVRTADIDTKTIYVCPGSDYTFADSTTVHNIQSPFTHIIHFSNINGCDSNYVINVMIAPVYSKTRNRTLCAGNDYYFPNNTILRNITRDTVYACRLASVYGCDSIIYYNLHVNPVSTTIVDAPVCRGGSYTLHYLNYTQTISNIIRDSTYVIHLYSQHYCDSIVKVQIRVLPQINLLQLASVCAGGSYAFPDGHVISNIINDTFYSSRLTAVTGCDSMISTHIRVVTSYYTSQSVTVCNGGSLMMPDGQIMYGIISATAYTSRLTAAGGCDSIITTFISVNPPPQTTQIVNICSGSSYTFPDGYTMFNITSDISYTTRYRPIGDCYSIVHTEIRVLPTYRFSETVSTCAGNSYTFPDGHTINNLANDTSYISRLTTAGGCDSIVTTNIHVYKTYNFSETVNTCRGINYTFPDGSTINNISSNSSHTSLLHTINGCDSTIITNINVVTIDTSVTKNNLALTSNANFSSYQWIDCVAGTAIAAATNQTYTASSIGSYAVKVSKEGCSDTSSCYIITEADILAGGRHLINVYPVPSTDHYTLIVQSDRPAILNILLLDFAGTQISQQNIHLSFGKNIIRQNISSLTRGTYTLVLRRSDNNETITKRIIKL